MATLNPTRSKSGLFPWIVWGLGALFYCYGFFQRVAPSVMVPDLMVEFGVSAAVLGNLSAFYFYAYAGLQLPIGVMFDHWGARRMLALAALLCGSGSLLFSMADTMTGAYAGRLLIGAGAGFSWVGALQLAARWLPPNRFALVTGLTLMLGMAGAIGGQAPLAAMVEIAGWRGTMLWAAGFALLLAALIWLIVRDKPVENDAPVPSVDDMEEEAKTLLHGLRSTISNRQSWFVAVYGGALTATMLSFAGLWGVPYLMQAYDISRPAAAASTSLLLVGWGIGAPLAGWLSDRMKRRKPLMVLGSLVALATFTAIIYTPSLSLGSVRVLLLINGFFSGSMVLSFAVAREYNHPESAGATLGFVNTFVMAAGAIFQPLIGWLLDLNWDGTIEAGARIYSASTYRMAFLTIVASGTASLLMGVLMKETHCTNIALNRSVKKT